MVDESTYWSRLSKHCRHMTLLDKHIPIAIALDTILGSFAGTLGVMPFSARPPSGRREASFEVLRATGVDTVVFGPSH